MIKGDNHALSSALTGLKLRHDDDDDDRFPQYDSHHDHGHHQPPPPHPTLQFRTIDGSGNNLDDPTMNAAGGDFSRVGDAHFAKSPF